MTSNQADLILIWPIILAYLIEGICFELTLSWPLACADRMSRRGVGRHDTGYSGMSSKKQFLDGRHTAWAWGSLQKHSWCVMSTQDASREASWVLRFWVFKTPIWHPICRQMARHGSWEDFDQTDLNSFPAHVFAFVIVGFRFQFPGFKPYSFRDVFGFQ